MKIYLSILFILLSFIQSNITAQSDYIQEWLANSVQVFKTNGKTKAQGLEAQIKLPDSYTIMDGDRPHVVAKCMLKDDITAPIIMMLINKAQGMEELVNEFSSKEFAEYSLEGMVGESKIIYHSDNIKIDGLKTFHYVILNSRIASTNVANVDIQIGSSAFDVMWKDYMISVQFQIHQYEINDHKIMNKLDKLKPFFNSVINTLVITSRWK